MKNLKNIKLNVENLLKEEEIKVNNLQSESKTEEQETLLPEQFVQWVESSNPWQVEPSAGPIENTHQSPFTIGSKFYVFQESLFSPIAAIPAVQSHFKKKRHEQRRYNEERTVEELIIEPREVAETKIVDIHVAIEEPVIFPEPAPEPEPAPQADDQVLKGSNKLDDILIADNGNDRLIGRNGDDFLDGKEGDDKLYGGKGDDTLIGGEGADRLIANKGDDILVADSHDTLINGGQGNDTLVIEAGKEIHIDRKVVKNIENISMDNDDDESVYLNLKDVVKLSNNDSLFIDGDEGDSVHVLNLDKGTREADVVHEGNTYAQFSHGKASLYVELGLELNDVILG